jgi:MarR family transcriptional regulator, negative regulator of the multidrug operon emrRAB
MSNRITSSQRRTANLLGALSGEINDRLVRMLQAHPNQTDSAAAALNVVAASEGLSNVALSQSLKLSHPATVRLVAKLKDEGLVDVRDAVDKRAIAIHITATGQQRVQDMLGDRNRILRDMIASLALDEQSQLEALLEKMLPPLASDACQAEYICRLCDHGCCSQKRCPVYLAIDGQRSL